MIVPSRNANTNTITSLFVSGIHPGTYDQYIYNIFSKLGKVHKINYNNGSRTAHVHIHHWYDKNPKIKTLMDRIKGGETVPIVHNVIDYWSVGLFQPNGNSRKNVATMKDLHIFAEKFGFNVVPCIHAAAASAASCTEEREKEKETKEEE